MVEIHQNRGFSLIELMVVVAIMIILLAIGIPQLSKYIKKYNVEKEITTLYGDLMNQRFKSMNSGVPHGIVIDNSTKYTLFKFYDSNYNLIFDNLSDAENAVERKLKFNLTAPVWPDNNSVIMFDKGGIYRNKEWGGTGISIYIDYPAKYNCIKIFVTRVKMGVLDDSKKCQVK
jgi:prepilin-type N-terminal cleavage/methylation domain-containing protein